MEPPCFPPRPANPHPRRSLCTDLEWKFTNGRTDTSGGSHPLGGLPTPEPKTIIHSLQSRFKTTPSWVDWFGTNARGRARREDTARLWSPALENALLVQK